MKLAILCSALGHLALTAVPPRTRDQPDYEYLVIGSGAGGGSVATTLAQAGHSVFLIEAGGDRGGELTQRIPALSSRAAEGLDSSWQFFVHHYEKNETQAERDPYFTYLTTNGSYHIGPNPPVGAEPLGIVYPRGATLGGSTQVNAMNLGPPPDHEWDYIASITGDDSFSGAAMRKYFQQLENCNYLPEGTEGHGFDGPITLSRNNISYLTGSAGKVEHLSAAVREVEGIDPGSPEALGDLLLRDPYPLGEYSEGLYMMTPAVTEMKIRSGARDWIIETVQATNEDGSRKYPLTLSTNSLVTRVLIDEDGELPRAYGVEYMVGEALYAADQRYDPETTGELRQVTASKEVIVAGGAFNTPQILKLSGVGPREELEDLGIPLFADVPAVDNYEAAVVANASIEWDNYREHCSFTLDATDPCYEDWLNGVGPYGEAAAPISLVFRSSVSDNEHLDLWLLGFPGGVADGFFPGFSRPTPAPAAISWDIVQMPGPGDDATGSVRLRSLDPRDTPIIDFDYFTGDAGQRDLEAMVEGAKLVLRIFDQTSEPVAPFTLFESEERFTSTQFFKDRTFGHHATGTCRMGPVNDRSACVDSNFRVQGVEGLRVVDASVFPRAPGAWPTVPTYMMGLKLADILAHENGQCA